MNQQYTVTQRWFSQYPFITSKSWTSFKIFLASFVLINFVLQLGYNWGNYYPSAAQRGQKDHTGHYRPILVVPFTYTPGNKDQVDLYARGHVDEYAFKNSIFSARNFF
jgi:hypothetical protein